MFQKNPTTSAVHPIGGTPGCAFRTAGIANSMDVITASVGGSTVRSLVHIVTAMVNTRPDIVQSMMKMKMAKTWVVNERVMWSSDAMERPFAPSETSLTSYSFPHIQIKKIRGYCKISSIYRFGMN